MGAGITRSVRSYSRSNWRLRPAALISPHQNSHSRQVLTDDQFQPQWSRRRSSSYSI